MHNSTDIYAAGEGTNGSVHSRFNFRPMGDSSVAFAPAQLKEGTASFFPTELPARAAALTAAVEGCTRHGLIGSCGRSCRTLCLPWLRSCRISPAKPWRCYGRY